MREKYIGITQTVKRNESQIHGRSICIYLFRKNDEYGVAVINNHKIAIAPDYRNPVSTLRTFPENIHDIVDWVDMATADQRYVELVRMDGEFEKQVLHIDRVGHAQHRHQSPKLVVINGGMAQTQ